MSIEKEIRAWREQVLLYSYFRSSAAYRVRIALNLKNIDYEIRSVHLAKGEQFEDPYKTLNAQGLVPLLVPDQSVDFNISQSLAIIDYLEESNPLPSLLPSLIEDRARCKAMAQMIACDIHPLNNLRVLNYLRQDLDASEAQVLAWYQHWTALGLEALEKSLAKAHSSMVSNTSTYFFGDKPTLMEVCLVPQVYNALRYKIDMGLYPKVNAINNTCLLHPAFETASPEMQADYFSD